MPGMASYLTMYGMFAYTIVAGLSTFFQIRGHMTTDYAVSTDVVDYADGRHSSTPCRWRLPSNEISSGFAV